MTETNIKETESKVYEIGYLLVSSIPEEKVPETVATLKGILEQAGASFIAEETAELRTLSYTMVKKIGSQNHRFSKGYFGWFKFEIVSGNIVEIKKAFESHKDMLRMLLITTVKESTYLGKKAPVPMIKTEEGSPESTVSAVPTTPVSIEEMDKSIDEMVKGA